VGARAGRLLLLLGVLGVLILVALASRRSSQPPDESACSRTVPDFAAAADFATLDRAANVDGDLTLAFAARDSSMTLVGFCSKSGKLPSVAPRLLEKDRQLAPGGGLLEEMSEGSRVDFVFAPTMALVLPIVHDQLPLGEIRFSGPPASVCPTPIPSGVQISCGAIYVLEAEFPIRASPDNILGVDGIVIEGPLSAGADQSPGEDVVVEDTGAGPSNLGFYFFGARAGSKGTVLSIGFNRPRGSVVGIELRAIYLLHGTTIDARGMSIEEEVPGRVSPPSP
jgi:hypothetical protein